MCEGLVDISCFVFFSVGFIDETTETTAKGTLYISKKIPQNDLVHHLLPGAHLKGQDTSRKQMLRCCCHLPLPIPRGVKPSARRPSLSPPPLHSLWVTELAPPTPSIKSGQSAPYMDLGCLGSGRRILGRVHHAGGEISKATCMR